MKKKKIISFVLSLMMVLTMCAEPAAVIKALAPVDGGPFYYGTYMEYYIVDGKAEITRVLGDTQYINLTFPTKLNDANGTSAEVSKVRSGAVSGLNSLVSIEINKNIELEPGAVSDCPNLTTVYPSGRKITSSEFVNCPKIPESRFDDEGGESGDDGNGDEDASVLYKGTEGWPAGIDDTFEQCGSTTTGDVVVKNYRALELHAYTSDYTIPTVTADGKRIVDFCNDRCKIYDMTGCSSACGERRGIKYIGNFRSVTIPEQITRVNFELSLDGATAYNAIDIYTSTDFAEFRVRFYGEVVLRIHGVPGSAVEEFCKNNPYVQFVKAKGKLRRIIIPKSVKYTGKPAVIPVSVYASDTIWCKQLTEGVDYTLSYSGDCTKPGTYTVKATGIGDYEGTVSDTFKILDGNAESGQDGDKSDSGNKNPSVTTEPKGKTLSDPGTKATVKVTNPGKAAGGKVTGAEVIYTKPDPSAKTVTIPDTVTVGKVEYAVTGIEKNAFSGNKKLKGVTIGKNVRTIGDKAFYKCTSLKKAAVPDSVTQIGSSAFAGCTKMTAATLGKKVKTIGAGAFSGDKKLKTITIRSTGITAIGKNALKGIKSKAVIKVPKSKYKDYKKKLKKGTGFKKTMKIKK